MGSQSWTRLSDFTSLHMNTAVLLLLVELKQVLCMVTGHSTCPPALPLWRASWFLFPNMDMLYNLFNFSLLTFRIFTSFSNRLLGPKVHTVKSLVRHWTAFQTVSCSHSRRTSVCLYLYRHCCLLALCLLLLSHFSRVRLCTTPQTAAHQAPPSPGFSRQEHWSGLPSPSPQPYV